MIVLKLPADAKDHPYHLAEVIAPYGRSVAKGDPVFRLVRAGTQESVTFRAPIAGKMGGYLIAAGTDLLSEPGQHIVTMERVAAAQTEADQPAPYEADARQSLAEIFIPDDPSVFPVRIDEWLAKTGDFVSLDQPIATVTLATGASHVFRSNTAGAVFSKAAGDGEYITRMARKFVTINTAAPPPKDWQPPAKSEPSAASPRRVTTPGSEESAAKSTDAAGTQSQTRVDGTEAASQPQTLTDQPGSDDEVSRFAGVLAVFGFFIVIALVFSYVFVGSRLVFAACVVAFLLPVVMFLRGKARPILVAGTVMAAGILVVLPQESVLFKDVTPWEPFGIAATGPDGLRHGDFWENLNRPRPTKRQQADFDKWLQG